MKTRSMYLKILTMVVTLMSFKAYASSDVKLAEDRRSLSVTITNDSKVRQVCDQVIVDLTIAGNEFNDVIGTHTLNLGPAYFSESVAPIQYDQVGADVIASYNRDPKPVILNATAKVSGCHAPTFADYCALVPRTPDEDETLRLILKDARTNDCAQAEKNIGSSLDLSEKHLQNVKPISFLLGLRKLYLSDNKIDDVQSLATLKQLEFLDISDNPVSDISAVILLPKVERIKANHTSVYYDDHLVLSPSLKHLELESTPYAKKVRKKQS
jgi:hypothetical protein